MISLRIDIADANAHQFAIGLQVPAPAAVQLVSVPAWIPGSYLVREFARHLSRLRARQGDREIEPRQLDKATWAFDCDDSDGAPPLVVDYRVYAFDTSVRAAFLDADRGFFNGTSVFLRVHGREHEPHALVLGALPEGWQAATALPESADAGDAGGDFHYTAADYDELVDHPFELGRFWHGEFDACGVPHEFVVAGALPRFDGERLLADAKRVCEAHIRFWHGAEAGPADVPFARYVFFLNAVDAGYGGLEHRASTALIAARRDLPRRGEAATGDGYATLLGLVSHEYFHAWNVKRMKPAEFSRIDYASENYTALLWFFEGFTSYYDDLLLLRSGLIDEARYLKLLAKTASAVLAAPGRHVQSVAQASFDAWVKYYRGDENTPNSTISYYAKGSLVALALDLALREAGDDGRASLDTVMRSLWQRRDGGPIDEADILQAVREAVGGAPGEAVADAAARLGARHRRPAAAGLAGACRHRLERAAADARPALGAAGRRKRAHRRQADERAERRRRRARRAERRRRTARRRRLARAPARRRAGGDRRRRRTSAAAGLARPARAVAHRAGRRRVRAGCGAADGAAGRGRRRRRDRRRGGVAVAAADRRAGAGGSDRAAPGMAARLIRPTPRRAAAAVALVGAVIALHAWVTGEVARRMGDFATAAAAPQRMVVSYVREMQLVAPPAALTVRAAPPAKPTKPKSAAARRALPAAPPVEASASAPDAEAVVAEAASAPADGATQEQPAAASADGEPASSAAASAPDAAGLAADAPSADAPAFEWPPSTRVTYRLTGNYRGEVQGDAQVEWIRAGSHYQVHVDLSVGPRIAPLVQRRMSSEGELGAAQLLPGRYDEETKAVFRDTRRVGVLFGADEIVLADGKRQPRVDGVQDSASQFIQMAVLFALRPDLLQAGGVVETILALPRSVDVWRYDVVGEETLATPFGAVAAWHLRPRRETRRPGELAAEIWFAPALRYLPVRIRIEHDAETYIDLMIDRRPELGA